MNFIQMLLALAEFQPTERDHTTKEVGDKVEMCSENFLNYFIDVETNQQLTIERNHITDDIKDLFMSKPMTVVANNVKKEFNCGHCDHIHTHDLIVYVPETNRRYFTSTTDVKLVIDKEI